MDVDVVVILFTQAVTLIGTIASIMATIHNRNAIQEVHLSINSRMDQLLIASRAEGRVAERDDAAAKIVEQKNGDTL
jgi:uncharacterized membrane protein